MKTIDRRCSECRADLTARMIPIPNKMLGGKTTPAKRRPAAIEVTIRYVNGGDANHPGIDLTESVIWCPDCAPPMLTDGLGAMVARFWQRVTRALDGSAR